MGNILASSVFRPLIEGDQAFTEECFDIMVLLPKYTGWQLPEDPILDLLRQIWLCHFHVERAQCKAMDQKPTGGKRKRSESGSLQMKKESTRRVRKIIERHIGI